MRKDDRVYFVHMLQFSERIADRVNKLTRATFDADENLQLAVTHLLQRVGEAARHVSEPMRSQAPLIPWRAITSMRHRLVHDYVHINLDVVWETATESVSILIENLTAVLKIVGDPRDENTLDEKN